MALKSVHTKVFVGIGLSMYRHRSFHRIGRLLVNTKKIIHQGSSDEISS